MKFDPKKTRRQLNSFLIELYQKQSFSEALESKALANSGIFMLDCAVECILVGLFGVGRELTLKALSFFRGAVEFHEISRRYSKGLSECYRLRGFALCNWLYHRQHDLKRLQEAAKWRDFWFEKHPKIARRDIQFALTEYLEAEEYQILVERFEQSGAKRPTDLRRIQGEGAMCYVIARHRLGLEYSTEEIDTAINTFLKRRVPQWLGIEARRDDAARWMKIAFWKKKDDPIATLLRCYDYLPGLKPPKYP